MQPTTITDVRTIGVTVTNQDDAVAFYVATLGFEKRLDAADQPDDAMDRGRACRRDAPRSPSSPATAPRAPAPTPASGSPCPTPKPSTPRCATVA